MADHKSYRKPPAYPIEAVDNALALIEVLRDFGAVHLSDAARQLGVSPSTAHRLMAMLVYRGFAEQDATRRYVPGPALGVGPVGLSWTAELRRRAQPHLELLAEQIDEAVNLMIRVGTDVRFLATVQGSRSLGVGDRQGTVMPAAKASAGKAILASMDDQEVEAIYRRRAEQQGRHFDPRQLQGLISELVGVRRRGYAANFEGTEAGVCALGVTVCDGAGAVVGGLTAASPRTRFLPLYEAGLATGVLNAKARLEIDLADFTAGAE